MIKKNTKIIFKDGEMGSEEEMIGGIPLSVGEIVRVHQNGAVVKYEVIVKDIDCFLDNDDQTVNIVYTVRKATKALLK